MNVSQRVVVLCGAAAALAMGAYPPWAHINRRSQERRYAYGWIFQPPPGPEQRVKGALGTAMDYPSIYPVQILHLAGSINNAMQHRSDSGPAELIQQFIAKNIQEYPKLARIRIITRSFAPSDPPGDGIPQYHDSWANHLVPDSFPRIELDGFTMPDGTRLPAKMEPEPGWTTELDATRLLVQWTTLCFVTAGLTWTLKDSGAKTATHL
jgi:hypothetical protein